VVDVSERKALWKFRRRVFALAFKAWCKTPRWLALRKWYLPFYGRVGYALDDLAYGWMREEYKRIREGHRG
jgi:hypothetical protein